MTTTTKNVNYSKTDLERLISAYDSCDSDAERKETIVKFSDALGKTTNSIIAKLSNMKVYIKPTKVSKTGEAIIKKGVLVDKIAEIMGEDAEEIETLEKANKTVLQKILKFISES